MALKYCLISVFKLYKYLVSSKTKFGINSPVQSKNCSLLTVNNYKSREKKTEQIFLPKSPTQLANKPTRIASLPHRPPNWSATRTGSGLSAQRNGGAVPNAFRSGRIAESGGRSWIGGFQRIWRVAEDALRKSLLNKKKIITWEKKNTI